MNKVLAYLKAEPARVVALVVAAIGLAATLGLSITDEQSGAIVAFVGAVLSIIGGETVRARVTPVSSPGEGE